MSNGFALRRNGTCLAQESSCGATASPFYACCPRGLICSNPYNQVCCESSTNCTETVVKQPVCGDSTWTLFNNGGVDSAYFCCLNNSSGYSATRTNSNGCGDPGYVLRSGEIRLQSLAQAVISSTSSSSSPTATPTTPQTSSPPNPTNRPSPATIAGATIGGILGITLLAALAIYLFLHLRRHTTSLSIFHRRARPDTTKSPHGHPSDPSQEIDGQPVSELPSTVLPRGVGEKTPARQRVELP